MNALAWVPPRQRVFHWEGEGGGGISQGRIARVERGR